MSAFPFIDMPRKEKWQPETPKGGVQTRTISTLGVGAGPFTIKCDDLDHRGKNIWLRRSGSYHGDTMLLDVADLKVLQAVVNAALNHIEMSR